MSTILFLFPFLLGYAILVIYTERKLSAFMQDRIGRMEVGYSGFLQTFVDLLKVIQKGDIIPVAVHRILFKIYIA